MHPSPLQLEKYFFSRVLIDSHVDGIVGTPNLLNCQVELGQASDNAKRYQVILRVRLESPPDKKATYTGEIHAVGLYRVVDDWPEDKVESLVETNGAGVLFGAARELIFNLTSRGPWPPVMLNTFTFIPVKDGQQFQQCEPPKEVGFNR